MILRVRAWPKARANSQERDQEFEPDTAFGAAQGTA
jgi:hypothetical protein